MNNQDRLLIYKSTLAHSHWFDFITPKQPHFKLIPSKVILKQTKQKETRPDIQVHPPPQSRLLCKDAMQSTKNSHLAHDT